MKAILLVIILSATLTSFKISAEEAHISPAQLNKDFSILYDSLKRAHVNLFENRTEREYEDLYSKMRKKLTQPMTLLRARMLFQEFVAYGRIAHARVEFLDEAFTQYRDQGGKAFPIFVRIDDGQWFVAENYSRQDLPLGAQITHIDGMPVKTWFESIWRYMSADTADIAASLIEHQLPQYLWLIDQNSDHQRKYSTIQVIHSEKTREFKMESISREELTKRTQEKPKSTHNTSAPMREFRLLSEGLGYLKPGPFYNAENQADIWDNTEFVAFIDNAFEHFIDHKVERLVIDVRSNPGGTNSFSDPMISWYADEPFKFASDFVIRSSKQAEESNLERMENSKLGTDPVSQQLAEAYENNPHGSVFSFKLEQAQPRVGQRFVGEVYVLVDRHSYSNAVSVAAITQDYGFGKVIGEPTTDFATTLASMETFVLPETGTTVGFPKAHIIRPSGDKTHGPVVPDLTIELGKGVEQWLIENLSGEIRK